MSDEIKPVSIFSGSKIWFSIFGASHAKVIGVCFSGIEKGTTIDAEELNFFMKRRAANDSVFSTTRREPDDVIFKSGVKNGAIAYNKKPVIAVIENKVQKSADYGEELTVIRPGHADYVGRIKFGKDYDHRGGGVFSGRMTAPLCILGGIAKQILEKRGIKVHAFIESVGNAKGKTYGDIDAETFDFSQVDPSFPLIDNGDREKMENEVKIARESGDSVGGRIGCVITGVPAGTGNVMFDSLESTVSRLAFGVPAVKGIEFGKGFSLTEMRGSSANDPFFIKDGVIKTKTNNNGGINGGIANGMPITFSVAVKPTPSISLEQDSVDIKSMQEVKIRINGRHDACIALRAVPVIESVAAIAVLDNL